MSVQNITHPDAMNSVDLYAHNISANQFSHDTYEFIVDNSPDSIAPYKTIQAAVNAAAATGQKRTVFVRAGVYNEDVTLFDKINLFGAGPNFSRHNYPAIINGTIRCNYDGHATINNFDLNSFAANCIESTSGSPLLAINNVNTSSTSSGSGIYINNPNATYIIRNCSADTIAVGGYFVNIDSCATCIMTETFTSVLGDNNSTPLRVARGTLAMLNCQCTSQIYVEGNISNNTFLLCLFNALFVGDTPTFITSNTPNIYCSYCFINSDPTSGSNFITGNANFLRSFLSLNGRSTVDPAITQLAPTAVIIS